MVEHERTGPFDMFIFVLSRIGMWLPAFIVSIMFFEVIMRYIFVSPTLWVNEMSLWTAGFVYLIAGLYAMQQRTHIRITLLYDACPRNLRRAFDVFSTACVVVFAFALIWGSYTEAYDKLMRWERFGTAWNPPIPATLKPAILITLLFLAIQAVSNLIADWNKDPIAVDPAEDFYIPTHDQPQADDSMKARRETRA